MENITNWLKTSGALIGITVGVAWLALHFGMVIIRKVIWRAIESDPSSGTQRAQELRYNTLVKIIGSIYKVSVIFIASLIILSELGVGLAPLFAGAGIFSLAIGFGAQDLVKDIVAGIFILFENQYRVGDIVDLEGASGKVEKMTLRVTVVRSMDGNVHYVPNGSIKQATNKTMEFSKVNLTINVAYGADIEKVEKIINALGKQLSSEKEWEDQILEKPHFLRVTKLGDSSVEIKVVGKTEPNKQWGVTGELRKRILKAFKKEQIEIPFPQIVVNKPK